MGNIARGMVRPFDVQLHVNVNKWSCACLQFLNASLLHDERLLLNVAIGDPFVKQFYELFIQYLLKNIFLLHDK